MKTKLVTFIVMGCLAFQFGIAQDPLLQDGNEAAEARAKYLAKTYQPELVMDGDQLHFFERKAEEFAIREQKIKSLDVSIEDKLYLLGQLSQQETEEMANILTRPQMKRYIKIKNRIQPVAVIVDTVSRKD